ncbi:hypothetical protein CFC21_065857 [Triticum aestivum]|uniref:PDZ domain-containing protein n=2 Tax=Triticum aestivum TaxID=4565 RepID=A0A9R1H5T0_WHEAT|nr:putative protease Do-like 14 [Triticum dicoccoides]XP_044381398.1 putative protease Do-like 14 [Triticum aestivum]KAF7058883.1 hypothetical protein CFC21_065857 [Triticum aestivum]
MEEMPPKKKRNQEEGEQRDLEKEAKAARLVFLLFGHGTQSEPEPKPKPACPPSPSSSSDHDGESNSDDDNDFSAEGLRARDAALSVCKSVVSISASTDGDPPSTFACTGTVVAHEGSATWIITSASLIRKPESDTEVHEPHAVKIEVLLHNKKVVKGRLLMYDLLYNVAIVSIARAKLPAAMLNDLPDSYFLTPGPVVAVARKFESGRLQMKRGETLRAACELDCDELMVSTCQFEQNFFIGGLLVDLEKRILGMNFIDERTTPFLPVQIVGRCLRHFKAYGEVKQPWLGIRGRSLHLLESARLEEICHKFSKPPSGVFVDMIPEASSANCGGVEVGDILNQLDGVVLHSIAQLTSLLLDKMEVAMHERRPVILKALIQRPKDGATVAAKLIVAERPPGECDTLLNNRWTLPPPTVYYWGPPDICDWVDDDSD